MVGIQKCFGLRPNFSLVLKRLADYCMKLKHF